MESGSTTIRNVGLVIGGVVAALLAVWRSRVAERQVETAQQSLLNERYQRGAEMLGSDVHTVRLGGIYALQRLAEEHPEQYHIQIMRLLCEFARHPTKDESDPADGDALSPRPDGDDAAASQHSQLRQDVQAVMAAISNCHAKQLDLEQTSEFRLDLRHANLTQADLEMTNLSGANLRNARLSRANLLGADLSFVDLAAAVLRDAELWKADLSRTNLLDANLSEAFLHDAILSDAMIAKANLSGASLMDANLSRTTLVSADLSHAILQDADLSETHLWNSNLLGADIRKANLSGAHFSIGLDQRSLTKLTQTQLDTARADPDNPPKIDGVVDAETGEPLVWRGEPLEDEA